MVDGKDNWQSVRNNDRNDQRCESCLVNQPAMLTEIANAFGRCCKVVDNRFAKLIRGETGDGVMYGEIWLGECKAAAIGLAPHPPTPLPAAAAHRTTQVLRYCWRCWR